MQFKVVIKINIKNVHFKLESEWGSVHKTQFLSRKFSIFFVSRWELMRGVLQCSSVTFPQQWIVLFGSMMAPFGACGWLRWTRLPANCSTVKVAHFKETFCRICLRCDIMYNKHLIAPPQYNIYCQYIYIYTYFNSVHCIVPVVLVYHDAVGSQVERMYLKVHQAALHHHKARWFQKSSFWSALHWQEEAWCHSGMRARPTEPASRSFMIVWTLFF